MSKKVKQQESSGNAPSVSKKTLQGHSQAFQVPNE